MHEELAAGELTLSHRIFTLLANQTTQLNLFQFEKSSGALLGVG